MPTEQLTILFCPQGDHWVAQCVEYDIAAQAKTVDDVLYEFQRVWNVQIAMDCELGIEPLSEVPPAPEHFRQMARAAFKIETQSLLPRFQSATKNRLRQFLPSADLRLANSLCLT